MINELLFPLYLLEELPMNIFKPKKTDSQKSAANHAEPVNKKPKVGIYGPEYRRLLAIELLSAPNCYCEQYYSLHIPTGSLCLTDHSYAGGYGGGYIDNVDELIQFDIPYEKFAEYCRKSSPVLELFFQGMTKQNVSEYIHKIENLPTKHLAWSVGEIILRRRDFVIIKPIRIYEYACVYLCRNENRSVLVLETISYRGSPMVGQAYSILKEIDPDNSSLEDMITFSDNIVREYHIANPINT